MKIFFFFRNSILEERKVIEKSILLLYKECEYFFISDDCIEDFWNEFEEFILDCCIVFWKWVNDLEKFDYSIVIVGKFKKE